MPYKTTYTARYPFKIRYIFIHANATLHKCKFRTADNHTLYAPYRCVKYYEGISTLAFTHIIQERVHTQHLYLARRKISSSTRIYATHLSPLSYNTSLQIVYFDARFPNKPLLLLLLLLLSSRSFRLEHFMHKTTPMVTKFPIVKELPSWYEFIHGIYLHFDVRMSLRGFVPYAEHVFGPSRVLLAAYIGSLDLLIINLTHHKCILH